jgi:hypothetical protein
MKKQTFMIVAVAAMLLCLGGCKTKYVPVERVTTDTLIITKQQRDSIWLHDSVHVTEKQAGDTIFLTTTKWHTKYVDRLRIDTIYEAKTDSVVTIQEVPAKLTWWQQTLLHLANIMLYVLGIAAIYGVVRLVWKLKG